MTECALQDHVPMCWVKNQGCSEVAQSNTGEHCRTALIHHHTSDFELILGCYVIRTSLMVSDFLY